MFHMSNIYGHKLQYSGNTQWFISTSCYMYMYMYIHVSLFQTEKQQIFGKSYIHKPK